MRRLKERVFERMENALDDRWMVKKRKTFQV
jgi:hypothetical protein